VSSERQGNVHVYTGSGKGKTTAAFGLAMRAAGKDMSVLVIQFLKGQGDFGEILSAKKLGIRVEQFGTGRLLFEDDVTDDDRRQAEAAMARAKQAVLNREADLIILDEINVAIHFKLLGVEDIIYVLDHRPKEVELVLTGRDARPEIITRADYVTEMLLQMHPYNLGQQARSGIEF